MFALIGHNVLQPQSVAQFCKLIYIYGCTLPVVQRREVETPIGSTSILNHG